MNSFECLRCVWSIRNSIFIFIWIKHSAKHLASFIHFNLCHANGMPFKYFWPHFFSFIPDWREWNSSNTDKITTHFISWWCMGNVKHFDKWTKKFANVQTLFRLNGAHCWKWCCCCYYLLMLLMMFISVDSRQFIHFRPRYTFNFQNWFILHFAWIWSVCLCARVFVGPTVYFTRNVHKNWKLNHNNPWILPS